MTKHKEKEEDIIKQKDMEKEIENEIEKDLVENSTDEIPPSGAGEAELAQEGESIEAVDAENEYLNNWKRCLADFENYKKQQAQAQKDFAKFANLDLIMQILPVIDNFHASTAHIPADQKENPWVVGIMYIQKQLESVLKDNGVEEIEVKEGDEFNPEVHEAVRGEQETNDKQQETNDTVKKVIMKGYKIDNKVVRAARVVVS